MLLIFVLNMNYTAFRWMKFIEIVVVKVMCAQIYIFLSMLWRYLPITTCTYPKIALLRHPLPQMCFSALVRNVRNI